MLPEQITIFLSLYSQFLTAIMKKNQVEKFPDTFQLLRKKKLCFDAWGCAEIRECWKGLKIDAKFKINLFDDNLKGNSVKNLLRP